MAEVLLFSGGLTRIDDRGQSTGIWKCAVAGPVRLGCEGLAGDVQADRRVHGGIDKALHQYAAENYRRLAEAFPAIAAQLLPGSIGENVSAGGFDEDSVCIGDVFRLGRARLQVSQPRSPCWKIDHRYATDGVARLIGEQGLTGWYYRVLDGAVVCSGDPLEMIDRLPGAVSLAGLWQVWRQHRPDPATLERLSAAPGLNTGWQKKLLDRVRWLRANGDRSAPVDATFHSRPR
ncbi:MAG TPA: MOSC domain-containing protein [Candidatus Accumulibacter sp.]|nr:MOSC domain-containing protein [Accumulibacter sp.]